MFCAFELPQTLRRAINDHAQRVREAVPEAAASWSRPENVHLTVKFFGNVDQAKVPIISASAARAAKESSAIEIEVGKTGVFPRPSRPQVLWIGVNDSSGALAKLQQRLEDEFASEGFPKENRPFRPHLTIARIRRPQNANQLAQIHLGLPFTDVAVRFDELILFRSELSSKGSKYT
ncbi:MAG TPA: RNA 2',3'-cyclic phosphodiesterase, partial [Pyrinomonadaceae bacterium]|nr:RNA 2',3'-cyclic phosphodiesterase [Pyrinomonadaceae bacterium]